MVQMCGLESTKLNRTRNCNTSRAICCRDDIMIYLIKMGLEPNPAFKIMESVRKGKVAKGKGT